VDAQVQGEKGDDKAEEADPDEVFQWKTVSLRWPWRTAGNVIP
jgi:hypothetical protein